MCTNDTNSRGFTTIEMLVVLGVTVLLSSILLLYNRAGERQIILLRDQARVVNAVLRAKALALQTYAAGAGRACGYGVRFEEGRFFIFKDIADDCLKSDKKYTGSEELFEEFALDKTNYFKELPINEIIFIPPDPMIILTPDKVEAVLIIAKREGSDSLSITINNAGQVTTR